MDIVIFVQKKCVQNLFHNDVLKQNGSFQHQVSASGKYLRKLWQSDDVVRLMVVIFKALQSAEEHFRNSFTSVIWSGKNEQNIRGL